MKKYLLFLVVFLLLVFPGVGLASDVSNAVFYSIIQTTNNGTAANIVSSNISGLNSTQLISSGYLNSSANNCAAQVNGADVTFMPGYGSNPWAIFRESLDANSVSDTITYFKNVTGGDIAYFPGDTGLMVYDTIPEISGNGDVTLNAYIDVTNNNSNQILAQKIGSLKLTADETSGNLTGRIIQFGDTYYTDGWTDVGTNINVNTTVARLRYNSLMNAGDQRCYKQLTTSTSNNTWKLSFTYCNTSNPVPGGTVAVGMFDAPGNYNAFPTDALYAVFSQAFGGVRIDYLEGGGGLSSAWIPLTVGNTYYVDLIRMSSTRAALYVYTDLARTTQVTGSPVFRTVPATVVSLDVIQVSNYNFASAALMLGWIDNLELMDYTYPVVRAGGLSSGEKVIKLATTSTGNFTLTVNGTLIDSVARYGITPPNNSENWSIGGNGTPFINTANITTGGTLRGSWNWEYGATFTDDTGNGYTGYPSFRITGSDPDVTSILTGFLPVNEPKAPAYIVGGGPDFLSDNITSTSNFTTGNVTLDYPGRDIIEAMAAATGTPSQLPGTMISMVILVIVGLMTGYFLRSQQAASMVMTFVAILVVMGVFVALHIWDWWMLIFWILLIIPTLHAGKERRES